MVIDLSNYFLAQIGNSIARKNPKYNQPGWASATQVESRHNTYENGNRSTVHNEDWLWIKPHVLHFRR